MTTKLGSLENAHDRLKAARLLYRGGVIGFYNRGVNAIIVDGENKKAVKRIKTIKGEGRNGRPVALTIGFEVFLKMVDTSNLTDEVKEILELRDLKKDLGSLCFIRAPLHERFKGEVPAEALLIDDAGDAWIQTWDPHGHDYTEDLINQTLKLGVKFPAITSMNVSGNPEIINQDEAELFCKDHNIDMYLRDENANSKLKGSYTIIALEKRGTRLVREGNIPSWIIEKILNLKIDKKDADEAKYPHMKFPSDELSELPPEEIRSRILSHIRG